MNFNGQNGISKKVLAMKKTCLCYYN